jgi:pimeloyl-ACP methyl ester carboxylesterase
MNPTFTQKFCEQEVRPEQRMAQRYRFNDPDMDLFFLAAVSWGPAGGLDVGQAWYVARQIIDGDADSWVTAFSRCGEELENQATAWAKRGWRREAGEARLKAFAAWRSAWQFAEAGSAQFNALYYSHARAFILAMLELALPVSFLHIPFAGTTLPGLFLRNAREDAPVVLVIGGADTCYEDLFLSVGRAFWERGYSVAIVDLPGQGNLAVGGLYWPVEPEHAISAIVDTLIAEYGARAGEIALLGMSLGGYFVCRAAMTERRLATVIASTPFPYPYQLFSLSAEAQQKSLIGGDLPTTAQQRSRRMFGWKAGISSLQALKARWEPARADPAAVTVPFLSVVGMGDSSTFISQGRQWHDQLASEHKSLVLLDASTGADAHCQVNARLRLVQEACGWMSEIFASSPSS